MKNKLWDSATFIASFLPRHLQMKTAGIIARQERKRVKIYLETWMVFCNGKGDDNRKISTKIFVV